MVQERPPVIVEGIQADQGGPTVLDHPVPVMPPEGTLRRWAEVDDLGVQGHHDSPTWSGLGTGTGSSGMTLWSEPRCRML